MSKPGAQTRARLWALFLIGSACACFSPAAGQTPLYPDALPDVDIVFTSNNEIYRIGMREAFSGLVRQTLLADDFAGRFIRRRPNHEDQFGYATRTGLVVRERCGGTIIDYIRPGTGSGFQNDFVWSHSGQFLVYGVYNGLFNGSPDPGVNRLNPDTGENLRLVTTQGFTYDHGPAYSLDDDKLSYIHHEYESLNWFGLVDGRGGPRQLWIQLPNTYRDEHPFCTWIDGEHVLCFNARASALIVVDTSVGAYTTFPIEGSAAQLSVSPSRRRYALRRPLRGPVRISYGEIGNWHSFKDVEFDGVVENFAWVNDDHLVVYTRNQIALVALESGDVHTITDVAITGTYGIEVLGNLSGRVDKSDASCICSSNLD